MKTDPMTESKKHYTVKQQANKYEYVFEVTVPADAFEKSYKSLLESEAKNLNIKGFRKGKVPMDMIEADIKPQILIQTFERVAPYYVNSAIISEKLEPVAPPKYDEVKELEPGKPVEITVTVTTMPEFTLGDMKKIKLDVPSDEPTEEEVTNTIETMHKNNEELAKKHKEVNDEWAVAISKQYNFDKVANLDDLKKVVIEAIQGQKSRIADQEISTSALEQAIELSKIEIPEAAVEYESSQREDAFMKDVKQMGITAEGFAERQGITMDDLKKRWMEDSLAALQNDAFFKTYAAAKDLKISEEVLDTEIAKAKAEAEAQEKSGKGDVDMTVYDSPNYRTYIESFLLKQKAYTEFMKEVDPREDKATSKQKETKKTDKKSAKSQANVAKDTKDKKGTKTSKVKKSTKQK